MLDVIRSRLFDDALDGIFRGFMAGPVSYEAASLPQFRIDVTEDANRYRIRADLPGVKKDDIAVTVEGDTVTVRAEVRAENETREGERALRSERHIGKLARSFALGQEVDEAGAQASYNDGVLDLVLPKKAAATRKQITIN